jgi:hypothetical protein
MYHTVAATTIQHLLAGAFVLIVGELVDQKSIRFPSLPAVFHDALTALSSSSIRWRLR